MMTNDVAPFVRGTGLATIAIALASIALSGCKQQAEDTPVTATGERLAAGAARVDADYLATGGDGRDWASAGFNYSGQRFSPLDAINAETVDRLGIAWFVDLPDSGPNDATPIIVDGVAYVATARSKVAAYTVKDGELLWDYDPRLAAEVTSPANGSFDRPVADNSIALWKGRLFAATFDGRLSALDAKTGVPLWTIQATEGGQSITTTPLVVRNLVIVGTGGTGNQARGSISAYDSVNGTLQWRFYTTPNPKGEPDSAASDPMLAVAAGTWSQDGQWRVSGGGGMVTGSIVYDADLDQLYFGTGPGRPGDYQARSGGNGDNLFLSSIVAVKPETGEYLWHYQTDPASARGFGATDPIILADFTVDGIPRKLLLHPSSSGFLYTLAREDGTLVSAAPLAKDVSWAKGYTADGRPVLAPIKDKDTAKDTKPVAKPVLDWRDGSAISLNPRTGRIYVPVQRRSTLTDAQPSDDPKAAAEPVRTPGAGGLVALAPLSGERIWATERALGGGTLATAGGMVFQGGEDGILVAYSANDGKELWRHDLQGPIRGAPSTFLLGNRQMIAVLVGSGAVALPPPESSEDESEAGTDTAPPESVMAMAPPRLVLFAIGGKRTLPPPKPAKPRPGDAIAGEANRTEDDAD